jgi:hypothetical protein
MDDFTLTVTIILSVCIAAFGVAAVVGSLFGIFVWYPRYRQKKVDTLKVTGRQGEATIIKLPDHKLEPDRSRRAVFTLVPIGLEIRVMGIETYKVDKTFTIPTHALERLELGKTVPVWVDPKEPRNLDKIVIDI